MKPLMILLSVFAAGLLMKKITVTNKVGIPFIGKLAMSGMLVFTGVAHFVFAEGMSHMLPESIPFRIEIIYLTGVLEILGGAGLLVKRFSRPTGIALVLFFVAVLPANIYAALHPIDSLTGALSRAGPEYLLFRIPLQIFFIAWIYVFAIRKEPAVNFYNNKITN